MKAPCRQYAARLKPGRDYAHLEIELHNRRGLSIVSISWQGDMRPTTPEANMWYEPRFTLPRHMRDASDLHRAFRMANWLEHQLKLSKAIFWHVTPAEVLDALDAAGATEYFVLDDRTAREKVASLPQPAANAAEGLP